MPDHFVGGFSPAWSTTPSGLAPTAHALTAEHAPVRVAAELLIDIGIVATRTTPLLQRDITGEQPTVALVIAQFLTSDQPPPVHNGSPLQLLAEEVAGNPHFVDALVVRGGTPSRDCG